MQNFFRQLASVSARSMVVVLLLLACLSCEKADFSDVGGKDEPTDIPAGSPVATFRIVGVEGDNYEDTIPYTRAADLSGLFSRLDIAMFQNGKRTVYEHLENTGDDAWAYSMVAEDNSVTVVFIAHSCAEHANIVQPDKITFPKNKVTDTFYYCATVSMEAKDSVYDIVLKRATAQICAIAPYGVDVQTSQLEFYYTGGSSTFDALAGCGCVDSRQTELRDIDAESAGEKQFFRLYTFPKANSKELKLTVTPVLKDGSEGEKTVYEKVPIVPGSVTTLQLGSVAAPEQKEVRLRLSAEDAPFELRFCY